MSLAPCFGVLLLCSHLLGQAVSDAPLSAQPRVADASLASARVHAAALPAALSTSITIPTSDAASPSPKSATEIPLTSIGGPEPGLLLLAGSLTVWFALARRRAGSARA